MTNHMAQRLKSHSLAAFFFLAYALSWIVMIPLALQAQGILHTRIPYKAHFFSAYGPLLAAVFVTRVMENGRSFRELLACMTRWRVAPRWWLAAVSPVLVAALISVLNLPPFEAGFSLNELGRIDGLTELGWVAPALWIVTFGLGEETGWRGFALTRLQRGRGALSATLILWCAWALWHLPLFFYSYPPSMIPAFLLSLLAGAINFTWLYNRSGKSIPIVAVFHGLFNLTTACVVCSDGLLAPLMSALVTAWAVLVVMLYGASRLFAQRANRRHRKPTHAKSQIEAPIRWHLK